MRYATCQQNEEDDTHAVDVGQLAGERLTFDYLWVLDLRSATYDLELLVCLETCCKTKVNELDLLELFVDDHVLNAQVPVHEAQLVHIVDGVYQLLENRFDFLFCQNGRPNFVVHEFYFLAVLFLIVEQVRTRAKLHN